VEWLKVKALSSSPRKEKKKKGILTSCRWLIPVILATQEAEIWRSWFKASPRRLARETKTYNKKGLVE
jgi:hypothetical protein